MIDGEQVLDVEVVVWRGAGEAAVLDELPTIQVRTDDERALATVAAEVKARVGLETAILDISRTHVHLDLLEAPPPGLTWRDTNAKVQGRAAWNRPGWFHEACRTLADALRGAAGAKDVGPFRQVKHWSISALIEVGSDVGTFWYKQVPSFMAHEAALTAWLATVRPGVVPNVVARAQDWSITAAFEPPSENRSLESPYGLLAELQLGVIDRTDELLALGCPDRTLANLAPELRALAERPSMLEPPLAQRLFEHLPLIAERAEALGASPIACSLVHGDLHGGNWTRQPNGEWLLFDWTDGCVSHPFVDLGVLPTKDDELREARRAAYLEPWRKSFGDEAVMATLETALPLAAGFHALSYERIVDGVGASDGDSWKPTLASFVSRLIDALP